MRYYPASVKVLPQGKLRVSCEDVRPIPMLDPDTMKPFNGVAVSGLEGWTDMAFYLPFKDGLRDGVEWGYYGDTTVYCEKHWRKNLFDGPCTTYFPDGSPCRKAFYDSQDSITSRLLSLEVWSQPGVKCPHSIIDENGTGEERHYSNDGILDLIIHYVRYKYQTVIIFDENSRILQIISYEGNRKRRTYEVDPSTCQLTDGDDDTPF
jgi:hypothetical protein